MAATKKDFQQIAEGLAFVADELALDREVIARLFAGEYQWHHQRFDVDLFVQAAIDHNTD